MTGMFASADRVIDVVYLALYAAAVASRLPYARAARRLPVRAHRRRGPETLLMIPVSIGLTFLPLVEVFSPWLDSFEMGVPLWSRVLGLTGFAGAVFLHGWTHHELRFNWSPLLEIREGHRLITTGPYRWVRHPMYAAFFIWSWSQGLALANWLVLVTGVLSFASLYLVRVSHEEALLLEAFGDDYRVYMERTGRMFPVRRRTGCRKCR